jgi:hypothetical protein
MTSLQQLASDDRADVAGAAGNEELHGVSAFEIKPRMNAGHLTDLQSPAR